MLITPRSYPLSGLFSQFHFRYFSVSFCVKGGGALSRQISDL
jgi:hypothetical protein